MAFHLFFFQFSFSIIDTFHAIMSNLLGLSSGHTTSVTKQNRFCNTPTQKVLVVFLKVMINKLFILIKKEFNSEIAYLWHYYTLFGRSGPIQVQCSNMSCPAKTYSYSRNTIFISIPPEDGLHAYLSTQALVSFSNYKTYLYCLRWLTQ